jgi:anti-sigma regulatory factor (Ser/Thr protein kinase)
VTAGSRDAVSRDDPSLLQLELERNDEAAGIARAAITGFSQDKDIPPGSMATLVLLTSEVVTNAVIHPDVDPPGVIGLCARIDQDTVRIEVTDAGSGFTPRPRDPNRLEGGFGLYLVAKESERWGVEQAPQTTVWFEVTRKR